ncbi:MAG: hypothetical protein QOJ21_3774, partial [Solirubrobacteraceae bacterium]|nr:hypothetical protein [Solirubrobacteraceae bacterium]
PGYDGPVGYKILGFVVWTGGRWFVRRKVNAMFSGRRLAAVGLVGGAVTGLAVLAARRSAS